MFRNMKWLYKMHPVWTWLKDRFILTFQYDSTYSWHMVVIMWLASCLVIAVRGLAHPTGLGLFVDLGIMLAMNTGLFCLSACIVAYVLAMMYVPVPRLFVGSVLYTGGVAFYILDDANLGLLFATVVSIVYTVTAVLTAALVAIALQDRTPYRVSLSWKMTSLMAAVSLVLCLVIFLAGAKQGYEVVVDNDRENSREHVQNGGESGYEEDAAGERNNGAAGHITPLPVESPAEYGPYSYHYFTYGSGQDKHRDEFGEGTDLISNTVDASAYIDEWQWKRQMFWGFDETELPLNGRVWMPEGEGPFPLVLMVHGNHRMENFSDDGYGYLGELLASRGFIAVSVDQNFLNYSSWSKTPQQDMQLRAWVLMQHLMEIQRFQEQPGTPFHRRVDLHQTALIGHSRGGLAAAMAVDRSKWFESDPSIVHMDGIDIQAVVGLAPTDRQVDGEVPELADVYYLVLHGAFDADVNSFRGDRMYGRTSFQEGSDRFKASLYIAEANHSQFNTDWGRTDISLPEGLFLNRGDLMDASAQREIAKVYISAFLEVALNGQEQYTDLFRDFRYGRKWLPDTQYVSRFENGKFSPLLDFDHMQNNKVYFRGTSIEAEGFSTWEIEEAKDRRRNEKGTSGVVLAWEDDARYKMELSEYYREEQLADHPDSFVFSMANMERDLIDSESNLDDAANAERPPGQAAFPHVEVEMETDEGDSVRVELDEVMPVPSPIYTQYTWHPWLDDMMRNGKYREATEPVFQTYEIPMSVLLEQNPRFRPEEITTIHLHFSGGPGKVMLDDIGFARF